MTTTQMLATPRTPLYNNAPRTYHLNAATAADTAASREVHERAWVAVSDHCRHCGMPYNCLKPVSTSGIAAGIRLQFCTPAVLYIRVFCIMLDSNICGNSAPHYTTGLTTQITPCSPRPDAVATRVQSDLQPSLTGCRR